MFVDGFFVLMETSEDEAHDDVTEVECLHWHIGLLRRLSSFKEEARDVVNECYSRRLCTLAACGALHRTRARTPENDQHGAGEVGGM